MKTESEATDAYSDCIREEGCPTVLRRDNAKAQTGKEFTALNCAYLIADELTEPHHQQQNSAELRAVKWLKRHCAILMDRTGAPPKTWLLACKYLAEVHNISADDTLHWAVPQTVRHGETVDISVFLKFMF
jgi:hypothetical protein